MLTDYTSYAEVRAVLGVSPKELPDATLALPIYETMLRDELDSISSSIVQFASDLNDQYDTIALIAPASRTAAQNKLYSTYQVYATFQVSYTLLTSLPYFGLKSVNDGRAEMQRQTDIFEDTRKGVESMLSKYKLRLLQAEASLLNTVYSPSATPRVLITSTGISEDPVTGV